MEFDGLSRLELPSLVASFKFIGTENAFRLDVK